MRITVIHGENSTSAYEKYRQVVDTAKAKGFDMILITDIKNIVSQNLFEDRNFFVLEKPNKVKISDWKWFKDNSSKYNSNLLIYSDREISAITFKNLPKDAKIEKFDYPKIIFNFLDSLYPGNSQKILRLLNDLVKQQPIELVFSMIARHLRDLYWAKIQAETMDLPDWRVLKLAKQSEKFELEDLKRIINELTEIDIKVKTSDNDLKELLDILILKNLK